MSYFNLKKDDVPLTFEFIFRAKRLRGMCCNMIRINITEMERSTLALKDGATDFEK